MLSNINLVSKYDLAFHRKGKITFVQKTGSNLCIFAFQASGGHGLG